MNVFEGPLGRMYGPTGKEGRGIATRGHICGITRAAEVPEANGSHDAPGRDQKRTGEGTPAKLVDRGPELEAGEMAGWMGVPSECPSHGKGTFGAVGYRWRRAAGRRHTFNVLLPTRWASGRVRRGAWGMVWPCNEVNEIKGKKRERVDGNCAEHGKAHQQESRPRTAPGPADHVDIPNVVSSTGTSDIRSRGRRRIGGLSQVP
ncbi:hypothetical protein LY78DRAFT_156243 [Colletotrichum sublineola]|nr:hypothetical protein LY78DRAFT_156243 [Colletotrichum sublineola]